MSGKGHPSRFFIIFDKSSGSFGLGRANQVGALDFAICLHKAIKCTGSPRNKHFLRLGGMTEARQIKWEV